MSWEGSQFGLAGSPTNARSSARTLGSRLIFGLIGVPVVLASIVSIYWIFRGKVKKEHLV